MNIEGKHYRTIWVKEGDEAKVCIINQQLLPHVFQIQEIDNMETLAEAIREMKVRGAGLIGAAAGYGMYFAAREATEENFLSEINVAAEKLISTRPTAVTLERAVKRQLGVIGKTLTKDQSVKAALQTAEEIANEDSESCKKIGEHGVEIIEEHSKKKGGKTVNILTHCNAGWLAFVDYGSALSPIYEAMKRGIKIHVWVDETRPRNQGASLTAWELEKQGVPCTLIVDNAGGHLMQHGMVDMVITGSDRVTRRGDVANKIGTYLKALAARDNGIPFYVAFPSSTIDWDISDGIKNIPIEERSSDEVKYIKGKVDNNIKKVLICPEETKAINYGFDVTPARLATAFITEKGICLPSEKGLKLLFSL